VAGEEQRRLTRESRSQGGELVSAALDAIARLKRLYEALLEKSAPDMADVLKSIPEFDRNRLVDAMRSMEEILFSTPRRGGVLLQIRSHKPGDMGYVAYRHGVLYEREHGFDTSFDGYVIGGLYQFAQQYDSDKDHLWVAQWRDQILGSIGIVNAGQGEAQLRWFLVEPEARDAGVGRRLLEVALEFCVRKGYHRVFLWTLSHLAAARSLYERFDFELTETKTHPIWGRTLTEERWDRVI
jgi:GNAT superfamily N-acetyltransferase